VGSGVVVGDNVASPKRLMLSRSRLGGLRGEKRRLDEDD